MIRLLTGRARIGLVVAAMAVAVAMVAFAQTTEPAIESVPASDEAAEVNTRPTGNDMSAQAEPSSRSAIPVEVEVEIQRHINELRREQMDDRESYFDRLLAIVAIFIVIAGYFGFKKFKAEAHHNVTASKQYAEEARRLVEEIKAKSHEAGFLVESISAQTVADNPSEANRAVEDVRENPEASLTHKAIARAVFLQQKGKSDEAIEKWRALAHIAEGSDNDLAAGSFFSVAYLIQDENPEGALADYAEAIRLKPDYAEAYNNRGAVKDKLGRYDDALADYAEAIRLKPDHANPYFNLGTAKAKLGRYDDALADYAEAIRLKPDHDGAFYNRGIAKAKLGRYEDALADYAEAIRLKPDHDGAYNNRGAVKDALGRYNDALADYDEAIRLKPDLAEAYGNRGNAKNALGLKDEARKDFETTLELARNANNAGVVAQAEQSLRDLDDGTRS